MREDQLFLAPDQPYLDFRDRVRTRSGGCVSVLESPESGADQLADPGGDQIFQSDRADVEQCLAQRLIAIDEAVELNAYVGNGKRRSADPGETAADDGGSPPQGEQREPVLERLEGENEVISGK
ncbi:hypothetical protein AB0J43_41150 [Nonomuraea fuscirosea]